MRYDAMRRDKINEHIGLEQEANTARIIANKEMNDAMILAQEKSSNLMSQSLSAGVGAMISSFAQLKKEGASTQKALLVSMLAGLKASIPIYVAQIVGKSLGEFTLAGIAVSAGLTAILYAALGAAESAVSSANFFKGGLVKAKNSSEYGVDKIKANLTHLEFVMNAKAVSVGKNREALEWSNKHNRPLEEYYKNDLATQTKYKVIEADKRLTKMLINEMRISNQRTAEMQMEVIKTTKELNTINAHLEEIEASAYRLETADFHKNINIDANVHGNENAFIKKIDFEYKATRRV